MANNKSSQKRIKITRRNRLQNRFYTSTIRTITKLFFKSLEKYKRSKSFEDKNKSINMLNKIYSLLDKGKKKGLFKKNNAARKKSRLAKSLKIILDSTQTD